MVKKRQKGCPFTPDASAEYEQLLRTVWRGAQIVNNILEIRLYRHQHAAGSLVGVEVKGQGFAGTAFNICGHA